MDDGTPSRWRWLVWAAVALLVLGGGWWWWRGKTEPAPEVAVRAAIDQFVAGVNAWELPQAMRVVSPRFHAGEIRRGDVSRGLFQARHDWQRLTIYVAEASLTVSPDGQAVTAVTRISLSGVRAGGGGEQTVGENKPIEVTSEWERTDGQWLCVSATNIPYAGVDGYFE